MLKAKDFFQSPKEIVSAIQKAETTTSGEIKIHVENKKPLQLEQRAQEVFFQLNMHELPLKNGVLIYISIQSKQIHILGDENIHQVVGVSFWNDIVEQMSEKFKLQQFDQGAIEAILQIGEQLKQHFPFDALNKSNDLSDDISYGD